VCEGSTPMMKRKNCCTGRASVERAANARGRSDPGGGSCLSRDGEGLALLIDVEKGLAESKRIDRRTDLDPPGLSVVCVEEVACDELACSWIWLVDSNFERQTERQTEGP